MFAGPTHLKFVALTFPKHCNRKMALVLFVLTFWPK